LSTTSSTRTNFRNRRRRRRSWAFSRASTQPSGGSYEALARDKYESSEPFRQEFEDWARENDYEPDADRTFRVAAKQYAYLLTNKVLFYEFVRRRTPDDIPTENNKPLDAIHGHTTLDYMEKHLRDCFDSIVEQVNYEAVFDDEASLFEGFPQNKKTLSRIEDFLNNIVNANIGEIDEDLLGGIYEELIPEQERKELGQYYTPPDCARIHGVCCRLG
jgi:type I restriction-modification system DNA methylase subunit